MAIINGPYASKMRGKVGEVVAAKTTGNRTALRSYQPNVKNPKTLRQQVSRRKFADLSALVSALAWPLNIGYAKAVNGTKMYPRNMALRDYSKNGSGVSFDEGGISIIDLDTLQLSKAIGIGVVPTVAYAAPSGQNDGSLTATNYADVEVNTAEEKLGIVYAIVRMDDDKTLTVVGMKFSEASLPVSISQAEATNYSGCYVMAFYKKMPRSANSVQTETWPWKYPSDTSATAHVATIQ